MSKQQMSVPNLEEIMAEFRTEIEETIVESVEKLPMEESHKKKGGEEEVEVRKERKNKRGEDEEEEESSGSKDEDFISNEKTLLKKGFIGEMGFKEIIPPFKEVIEKRGWTSICTHLPVRLVAMVRDFMQIHGTEGSFKVM